ncbi:MAG TPA: urea ABC transporter permease subunit UrtB, partial [Verrucomicrobiales bacterium]|nr:urea ABC transporter permease subunit UrtB [Verrucomicrobiales bacterium]
MPAMKKAWLFCLLATLLSSALSSAQEAKSARAIIAEAVVLTEDSDAQVKLINSLTGMSDPDLEPLLDAWKGGSIYLVEGPDDKYIAVTLAGDPDATKKETALRLDTKEPLKDAQGAVIRVSPARAEIAETDSSIRRAMKSLLDLSKLTAPEAKDRMLAITQMGMERDLAKLPILEQR